MKNYFKHLDINKNLNKTVHIPQDNQSNVFNSYDFYTQDFAVSSVFANGGMNSFNKASEYNESNFSGPDRYDMSRNTDYQQVGSFRASQIGFDGVNTFSTQRGSFNVPTLANQGNFAENKFFEQGNSCQIQSSSSSDLEIKDIYSEITKLLEYEIKQSLRR